MFPINDGIKHKADTWFLEYLIRTVPDTHDYKLTKEKTYQNLELNPPQYFWELGSK